MRHHDNYHDDHRVRAGERQSIFSSVDADRLLGKIILERQESDAVAEPTGSCGTANTPSDRGATTIAILYPSRGMVSIEQIQRWAHDDLSNEEGRSAQDDIPAEFALAIVGYYGSVTIADGHGYSLPEWSAGDPVPSVRFIFDCKGHHPGPLDPMGGTVYCDGACRRHAVLGLWSARGSALRRSSIGSRTSSWRQTWRGS